MTIRTQVVIIGAGPSGLFQVFELGLLGISAHVVDSLAAIGGQCSALYPDKPIYDIPGLPVCAARELVDRLQQQIQPFAATFHLGQEVVALQPTPDDGFYLRTSGNTEFLARAVVIAGGLGSFQPRPLRLPGIEHINATNLHYKVIDRERFRGKRLAILGGGDSALDWSLDLRTIADQVTLIHRREAFRATPASVAKLKKLSDDPNSRLDYRVAKVQGFVATDQEISGLEIVIDGAQSLLRLDELLVFFGLSPNLGPIAEWGLEVERRQVSVDSEKFETAVPGVFAIGDINTYPGKKKLILSGFHEAALAAFGIQKRLFPEQKQYVQYTTTSPIMHERLGLTRSAAS